MPDANRKPTGGPSVRTVPTGKTRRNLSPGSPDQLQRHIWYALRRAGDVLDDPASTSADILRAAHAVAGVANAWSRAFEVHTLRSELDELRAMVETLTTAQDGKR